MMWPYLAVGTVAAKLRVGQKAGHYWLASIKLGRVIDLGIGVAAFRAGNSFVGSKLQQRKVYDAYVAAAERAIERCTASFPEGTAEWNAVVGLLKSPERAMGVAQAIESSAFHPTAFPEITPNVRPFVEGFARDLALGLVGVVPGGVGAGVTAVLITLGSMMEEIRRLNRPEGADPAEEAWFLDLDLPRFRIHHASSAELIQFEIEQIGGTLPVYFWRYRGPALASVWKRNNELSPYHKTAAHIARATLEGAAANADEWVGPNEMGMEFAFWFKGAWRHLIRRFPAQDGAPLGRDRHFTGSGDPNWDPTGT